MLNGIDGHDLAGAIPGRGRLPLLGLVATLLISAQPLLGQQRMATQSLSTLPTWQSSPVLTKFLEELRAPGKIPVALPDGIRSFAGSPVVADHYTIDINEFKDTLHPSLPPTTLWGYNPTLALGVGAGAVVPQSHLGGILIAQRGRPIQITFRNNLPDQNILPVDTSIQGSDPSMTQNRTSTHLHGGAVPWISDGGPFGFWDRAGNKGISFKNNEVLRPTEWALGHIPANEAEYYYPNDQSARLAWYHDHAMGITRLNAYAGIASAYIIRDKFEANMVKYFGLPKLVENGGRELPLVFQDKVFQNGSVANPDRPFPGSAKSLGDLWYPYEYDENKWGPSTAPSVSVVPEAYGDTMLVNGTAFPRATVDPRRYRFRILNACQARVLNLQLYEDNGQGLPDFTKPGPNWIVIGTEGGFLARAVAVPSGVPIRTTADAAGRMVVDPAAPGGSLIVAPAERLDLVMDFNGKGGKKYILYNDAPAPYPNGSWDNDYPNAAGVGDTSVLMRFEVKPDSRAIAKDNPFLLGLGIPMAGNPDARIDPPLAGRFPNMPPEFLTWLTATSAPLPIPTRKGITVRQLTLNEAFDANGRLIQMLGTNVAPTTVGEFSRPYGDPADPLSQATETPAEGATEVWQIANLTGDTHPIHFHLTNAQILSRRFFDTVAYAATPVGVPAVPGYDPKYPARGPEPTEVGWKETVKMHPGEVTTVIMKFNLPKVPFTVPQSPRTGGHEFVWHCHILEHEEHDMMRTLVVK